MSERSPVATPPPEDLPPDAASLAPEPATSASSAPLPASATVPVSATVAGPAAVAPPEVEVPLVVAFREGLYGGLISLVCLFPPGVHLITGPLGPLIGGGFAGVRTAAKAPQARLIAVTIGAVVVGGAGSLAFIGSLLFANARGPAPAEGLGSLQGDVLVAISLGLALYQTLLGWLGARLGGWLRRMDT